MSVYLNGKARNHVPGPSEVAEKLISAQSVDTPWKHDHSSTYMESIVVSIEHAQNNTARREMNETAPAHDYLPPSK